MPERPDLLVAESPTSVRKNLILDYYDRLPAAVAAIVDDPAARTAAGSFAPAFAFPERDDQVDEYFAAATASWRELGGYLGHRMMLLDLTGNPGTHTTKTFPSLLIVARAVEHIRRTGEAVMIFSPTSANKGTALRDAVLRALDLGLAPAELLRVGVLAPRRSIGKLRRSRLSDDPVLRDLNPVFVYEGDDPEGVKQLAREFSTQHAQELRSRHNLNLWFSLELQNYLIADTARAFFEHDVAPCDGAQQRVHTHAVSSAFGLLGYHEGRSLLERADESSGAARPASLLIQHLGAPDMVLNLRNGSFDRSGLPSYRHDPATGRHVQTADPRFPRITDDPQETLDPTFYTHRPATSPRMNAIIGRHGGDGIVVSLAECLERYPLIRQWLAISDRPLPADLRTLREWSTVMAFTGTLEAVDRGLLPTGSDIVVHGSGWYSSSDFDPLPASFLTPSRTVDDLRAVFTV